MRKAELIARYEQGVMNRLYDHWLALGDKNRVMFNGGRQTHKNLIQTDLSKIRPRSYTFPFTYAKNKMAKRTKKAGNTFTITINLVTNDYKLDDETVAEAVEEWLQEQETVVSWEVDVEMMDEADDDEDWT